jgi:hypothetical protein
LRQNLQQVAPNQEKPHTTPLHSLIYSIYISVHLPGLSAASDTIFSNLFWKFSSPVPG